MAEFIKINNGNRVEYNSNSMQDYHRAKARANRNALLADCDVMMTIDYPISEEKKEEWKTYRQSLRDMDFTLLTYDDETSTLTDNLQFPVKP